MAVLARKISRAKWEASDDLGEGEIQADAVSADLRTTGNTLSFWRCTSASETDLQRVILALTAAHRPKNPARWILSTAGLDQRSNVEEQR